MQRTLARLSSSRFYAHADPQNNSMRLMLLRFDDCLMGVRDWSAIPGISSRVIHFSVNSIYQIQTKQTEIPMRNEKRGNTDHRWSQLDLSCWERCGGCGNDLWIIYIAKQPLLTCYIYIQESDYYWSKSVTDIAIQQHQQEPQRLNNSNDKKKR